MLRAGYQRDSPVTPALEADRNVTNVQNILAPLLGRMGGCSVFLPLYPIYFWVTNHAAAMPVAVLALWHIVNSVIWYAYSVVLHGKYGQTLGKMAMHVKVMDVAEFGKSISNRLSCAMLCR